MGIAPPLAQPGAFTSPGIRATFGDQLANKFAGLHKLFKLKKIEAACKRLETLDADVQTHAASSSLDLLQRYIPDSEVFIEDIEDASAGSVRRWNLGRTVCALLPLLITWLSLALATVLYKGEPGQISTTAAQTIPSFLAQWQSGFGGTWPWFRFYYVALLDALLIVGVIICTVFVHSAEARPKEIIKEVESSIDQAIKELLKEIERRGAVNPASAPSLVRDSAKMMRDAVQQLKDAADKWNTAATSTEATIRAIGKDSAATLSALGTQIQGDLRAAQLGIEAVLTALKADIQQVIRNEMGTILAQYRTTLTDFERQVTNYTAASTELVGEAKKLSTAGGTLAAEATAYTAVARDINTNMGKLTTSHTDFVGKVDGIATGMGTAATKMTTLVDTISTSLQPELKTLVDEAADTSVALTAASRSLQGTTGDMRTASNALQTAITQLPGNLAGISPANVSSGFSGWLRWLLIVVLVLVGIQASIPLLGFLGSLLTAFIHFL